MDTSKGGNLSIGAVPQVGAILHLNTELVVEQPELGHEYWRLDGSCVLVDSNRITTVRHTVAKPGRTAVLFPREGIIDLELGDALERDHRISGDNVVLVPLKRSVRHTAPLAPEKVWKFEQRDALVMGYGLWTHRAKRYTDGIQRYASVELHLPEDYEGPSYHYDNLDLCWWSFRNDCLEAGLNNSGGPMLRVTGSGPSTRYSVIGLSREAYGEQQIGSWVTNDRIAWLRKKIPWLGKGDPPAPAEPPVSTVLRDLNVRADTGGVETIPVPEGAERISVTLCATDGIRLQMGIGFDLDAGQQTAHLQDWAKSDRNSGRFLHRTEDIPSGAETAHVGVVRVASSVSDVERVQAQLCCTFF